jgi:hypothetical protein
MYLALYEPIDMLPGVTRPIYVLGEVRLNAGLCAILLIYKETYIMYAEPICRICGCNILLHCRSHAIGKSVAQVAVIEEQARFIFHRANIVHAAICVSQIFNSQ